MWRNMLGMRGRVDFLDLLINKLLQRPFSTRNSQIVGRTNKACRKFTNKTSVKEIRKADNVKDSPGKIAIPQKGLHQVMEEEYWVHDDSNNLKPRLYAHARPLRRHSLHLQAKPTRLSFSNDNGRCTISLSHWLRPSKKASLIQAPSVLILTCAEPSMIPSLSSN